MEQLPISEHLGILDISTVTDEWSRAVEDDANTRQLEQRPPLSAILNLNDFEEVAKQSFPPKSWAFISDGSNDRITLDANKDWFRKVWFHPRVMVDVGTVNTRSKILGYDASIPVFISPTGVAKAAGTEGELALGRAAAATGIIQCVSTSYRYSSLELKANFYKKLSTNSSYSLSEVLASAPKNYPLFFQLYFNKDRNKTEVLIRDAVAQGVKAIFLTVDLPVVSKREADERLRQQTVMTSALSGEKSNSSKKSSKAAGLGNGLARNIGSFIDPKLSWDDLHWLRKQTKLPIILKGIQSAADARKAMEMGVEGIVISNHGGRALDSTSPSILILLELHLECPEVFSAMEVMIDGGIRRGSDILKAICLGASAVGLGRPFLYALNYGREGIEHAVNSEATPFRLLFVDSSTL